MIRPLMFWFEHWLYKRFLFAVISTCLCIYRYIVFTKFTLHFSYSEYTKLFEHARLTHVSLKFLPACMSFYVIKFVFSSSFFTPFLSFFSFSFFYYFFFYGPIFSTPRMHDQTLSCMVAALPRYPTSKSPAPSPPPLKMSRP